MITRFTKIVSVILLSSSLSACNVASDPQQHKIEVSGQGSVSLKPDRLEFSIAIDKRGKNASDLKDEVNQIAQRIVEDALAIGVKESSLQTQRLNLRPWVEWQDNQQINRGFIVSQQITVTLTDFEFYSKMIESVFEQGATGLNGFQFTFSDEQNSTGYGHALQLAVDDARQRAQIIAKQANLTLGGITQVIEQSGYSRPNVRAMAMKGAESDALMMPGTDEIKAQVSVQFSIH